MGRQKLLSKEQVLAAIRRGLIQHGVPPTVEELRKALQLGSKRTVLRYLQWLEKDGDIERWEGARGLKLLRAREKGLETVAIPIVGEAPAGPLMVAEENVEGWLRFPKNTLRPSSAKFFILRVRGDSMNKAIVDGNRIENGDLVVVRQQPVAEVGDVVVALIDGEATIKRFEKGPNYFLLRPQSTNAAHKAIVVDRDFYLAGIVCRVLKKGSDLLRSQS